MYVYILNYISFFAFKCNDMKCFTVYMTHTGLTHIYIYITQYWVTVITALPYHDECHHCFSVTSGIVVTLLSDFRRNKLSAPE